LSVESIARETGVIDKDEEVMPALAATIYG
jgi:hypothetical protein